MKSAFMRHAAMAAAVLLMGLVASAVNAQGLSPAAALGPEVTVGKPESGYIGQLTVTPDHGPVGTPVKVAGDGLPPNQEFELIWRTVNGRWKVAQAQYLGREYTPIAYQIARVRTDGAGRFATTFRTPEDFGFSHDIIVQQGQRVFTQAGFSIDMSVSLSPKNGPLGTPITVSATGIGWRQLQNSWLLLYDNKFTGWISAVTTAGSARFTIPATGNPGTHVVEIVHGEFTFPYRNMQQSPQPDRPQFALHFTMTEGLPALPVSPELQTQSDVRRLPPSGALTASPAFGTVGAPVVVRGSGFAPGKAVELDWATVTGNRVGGSGWEEKSHVVATSTANAAGEAAFHFNVPDDLGGAHQLSVTGDTDKQTGTFWIVASAASLSVNQGEAGTLFKIHLNGVGWTETANIYTIVYDNNYVGYACGFNSQGDIEIPLVATGEPGWHFIDLYPAIYKGTESRPRNFRIPQLTYAADHPGEDLPHFRFAFRVTVDTSPSAEPR
jgi:hypothetical protein